MLRPEIADGFARTLDAMTRGARRPIDYLEIGSCHGMSMSLVALLLQAQGSLGTLTSVDPYFPVSDLAASARAFA